MKTKNIILTLALSFIFANAGAQKIKTDISNLSLNRLDWSLYINLDGFTMEKNIVSMDGMKREIFATNKANGLVISIFIEKAEREGDEKECRSYYCKKGESNPMPRENLVEYEKGNIAFFEHDIVAVKGQKVDYHSMNAFLSVSSSWIDIHISKIGYTPNDKALFDALINTVEIKRPKVRNVSELFIEGNQAFYTGKYRTASECLEQILVSEQEAITLDKTIWLMVVDNLGMAYGMNTDYENAKRVFEYGIKLDPKYPLFYYNLACTYAETNDLDNALINLALAYEYRGNRINGEKMPNPKEDNSFAAYKNDQRFKDFVKTHKF